MRKTIQRAAAAASVAVVAAACGAKTGLLVPEPKPVEPDDCVSLQASAPLADLDVFIMMDASGSMEYATADGTSKWEAVRAAVAAFVLDVNSKGIGAAITFFPVIDPAVPAVCADDNVCGVPDYCTRYAICYPGSGEDCESDADCAALGFPDDKCEKLGFCELDNEYPCLLSQPEVGCGDDLGACLDVGLCDNHYDCKEETYASPAVDVAVLPGGASAVLGAIDERIPDGATTTLPALTGAIQRASEWVQATQGHKAIVVLATDGLPTVCDPALKNDMPELAIQHLVDVAAGGAKNGIQTFVIGVFNDEEAAEAAPNLDAIAAGGGTKSAYLISTEDNVAQKFLDALNEVRLTSKSCEFAIPLIDGKLPDLSHLSVRITPPNGAPIIVERVGSADECSATKGGFYYDTDPSGPTPPTRIILCQASCDLFGSAQDRIVDILVSCEE